jgi:hypothetical protein
MACKRQTYKLLAIRPETERLIEKHSKRCDNNIKNIETLVWRAISELIWIDIRKRARNVVDMVMNICFFIKYREVLEYLKTTQKLRRIILLPSSGTKEIPRGYDRCIRTHCIECGHSDRGEEESRGNPVRASSRCEQKI